METSNEKDLVIKGTCACCGKKDVNTQINPYRKDWCCEDCWEQIEEYQQELRNETNQSEVEQKPTIEMGLNERITEMKLEEIRVYITSFFSMKEEETRQGALNLVVESFYSKNFQAIKKANYGEEVK